MKKGYGKKKGSSFERKIARELSKWISKDQQNDIFWRTHSSGFLGTVGKRKSEYGDIMAIDDLGKLLTDKFNIECRHGKIIKIKDLIYAKKKSNFIKFIQEGKKNAELSNREPLWIFKEQNMEILVMMDDIEKNISKFSQGSILGKYPKFGIFLISFVDWKKEYSIPDK